MEQGGNRFLPALMQLRRDMTRHVPGSRWATGFLLVMLWLQVSPHVTEAAKNTNQSEGQDIQAHVQTGVQPWKNIRRVRETVHLLTPQGPDGKVVPLHKNGIYSWLMSSKTRNVFKLVDNSTTLVVPKKGLYIVNLKMYYQIPTEHKCKESLYLFTVIKQYHPSYPEWREVIKGIDTMQCVDHWRQSVTLSQVVRFEKGTKLRVIIDPMNYDFIIGDQSTYFSVTLL